MREPLPKRWVRFSVSEESLQTLPGWLGFAVLDALIRKGWPGYQGVDLKHVEGSPDLIYSRLTFHVW